MSSAAQTPSAVPRVLPRLSAIVAKSKIDLLANPALDSRVLFVLAGLLLLAQLPQVLRLPIWLSIAGIGLIVARVLMLRAGRPAPHSYWLIPIVLAGTFAIRWHYGYFFGRDPGVALLFLMAGLKFMETRRERDGTLTVCLAAFLAMTQFLYEQSITSAAMLVVTVLYIAFALHALSGTWARVDDSTSHLDSFRPLLRVGGVMLLQSIPLALVLFLLFPRLSSPLWGMPSDHSSKTGLSEHMEFGNISNLTLSDDVAFHVDFPDKSQIPPNPDRYWRGPVLSQFDGRVWRTAARGGGTGAIVPANSATGPAVSYVVTLEPHQQTWLFALELPASMPQTNSGMPLRGTMLTREQQLVSTQTVASRVIYRQTSNLSWQYPESITAAESTRLLRLPGTSNAQTREFARKERQKFNNDGAFVQAMLNRFGFEAYAYTMSPPAVGDDSIDDFLFKTKSGFCEHYAGAFTFMMRAAGIPARVVTGYMGGEINPSSGAMVVRQSDAHAWSEVYLNGLWLRIDPTASVSPDRIERGFAQSMADSDRLPFLSRPQWSWMRSIEWRMDAVNHSWQKWVIGFDHDRQQSLFTEMGWPRPKPWEIVGLIIAAFGAWGLGYLGWSRWLKRIRTHDPLERAWQRVNRRLARAGLPRQASEGPMSYAERLCQRWPRHAAIWREVSELYASGRYGEAGSRDGAARMIRAVSRVRVSELRTKTV